MTYDAGGKSPWVVRYANGADCGVDPAGGCLAMRGISGVGVIGRVERTKDSTERTGYDENPQPAVAIVQVNRRKESP